MEYLPVLHPLWKWKLHRTKEDPALFMKLCKSHLMDISDSMGIVKILDFVDDLIGNSNSIYHFSFEQFMVIAPFFLHQFIIQNKYYQSITNKFLFSNSIQCKYKSCKHRMKIQINFQLKEVTLNGVNDHCHELNSIDNSHSWFIRSIFESFAKTGITSAPMLIKAVKMSIGADLYSKEECDLLHKRLCLNDIQQSYAYNIIERVKNDFDSMIKSIGQEFESVENTISIQKKKRKHDSHHQGQIVWRLPP